jgi:hypothetical protein
MMQSDTHTSKQKTNEREGLVVQQEIKVPSIQKKKMNNNVKNQ